MYTQTVQSLKNIDYYTNIVYKLCILNTYTNNIDCHNEIYHILKKV